MKTNFEKVQKFHRVMGVEEGRKHFWDNKRMLSRLTLIDEEYKELIDAINAKDIVEVADALTDILYVVYGMGSVLEIDLDACFKEVHKSNMTKLGDDGKPVINSNGKIVKGKNFRPPELKGIVEDVFNI